VQERSLQEENKALQKEVSCQILWHLYCIEIRKGLMCSPLVQLTERQKAAASRQQQQVQWEQQAQKTEAQTSSSSSSFLMRQDSQALPPPQNIRYTQVHI
jgi:MADS-box transcription factor